MGIVASNINKEFGKTHQRVLKNINVEIKVGEFISISGRSGSGKSTLLYLLSTLDNPTDGEVLIDGKSPALMDSKSLHLFRNKHVGFIFQFHYLLPELNAIENILLGAKNLGLENQTKSRAFELLDILEITDQTYKRPSEMSGGQQQRVAIARALALRPRYIFADEPTGNLDSISGKRVMELLKEINKKDETTVVLVTHDPGYAALAQREIFLVDGEVQ